MESGPHSGSELSMVKTEFIRKTTFIRNSSSFIYNSTGVGDEELSSSVSVYKRNSSWLPLRSLLYATGAIMAREHEDTSSSSRFLPNLPAAFSEIRNYCDFLSYVKCFVDF